MRPDTAAQNSGELAQTYTYDAIGNRTRSATQPGDWHYNADNPLTDWGQGVEASQITYTDNGHTATETQGGSTTIYTYNAFDRISAIQRNGQTLAQYQYDAQGRGALCADAAAFMCLR